MKTITDTADVIRAANNHGCLRMLLAPLPAGKTRTGVIDNLIFFRHGDAFTMLEFSGADIARNHFELYQRTLAATSRYCKQ